jgi:hypothetical protein
MSVAGYEKVKTKVIEGKKKCIYKKYKGTKLYVKGFGKMRSVESYIKLCKKAAAKSAKSAKPMKTKKTRSKTTRKYGGFLQEFFTNLEQMDTEGKDPTKKSANKSSTSAASAAANGETAVKQHFNNAMPTPASPASPATPDTPPVEMMSQKMGGGSSSCSRQGGNRGGYRGGNSGLGQLFNAFGASGGYRGGQSLDQFQDQDKFSNQTDQFQDQDQDQTGGRRRKRRKTPKSMLDKLMMAANFGKRSAKKGKKLRRKGGNALADSANVLGSFTDSLTKGGKKKKRNGGFSQFDY